MSTKKTTSGLGQINRLTDMGQLMVWGKLTNLGQYIIIIYMKKKN